MTRAALSDTDVMLAALLFALNGAISLAFGLRLELSLAIAAVRMMVQLAAMGFVLKFVFLQSSALWTAAVAIVMLLIAGYDLLQQQERRFKGWWAYGLGNATLLFAAGLATLYAVAVVIAPSPWYAPRYLLPIFGMVLGSTLTSISLVLQTLTEGIDRERGAIEARLAQGGTRFAAFAPLTRRAMRTATTPLLNIMSLRFGHPAWHDDRPNPCRRRSPRGRQVSDRAHVRVGRRRWARRVCGRPGWRVSAQRHTAPPAPRPLGSGRLSVAAQRDNARGYGPGGDDPAVCARYPSTEAIEPPLHTGRAGCQQHVGPQECRSPIGDLEA